MSSQFEEDISLVLDDSIVDQVLLSLRACNNSNLSSEDEIDLYINNEKKHWRFLYSPLASKFSDIDSILVTCIDITEKKLLEISLDNSLRRFEAVIYSAYDGIISVDDDFNIKLFNDAATKMFGYEKDAVIGMPLARLIPRQHHRHHDQYLADFIESPVESRQMHARASVSGVRKDGSEFPVEITIAKITVGKSIELTAVLRDISERDHLIQELTEAASLDPLTGIYNRRFFVQQLDNERKRCRRFDHQLSLVMFDLDNFKNINDIQGHKEGDIALTSIVQQVKENMRDVDIFSRWGGDEFLIMLPETGLDQAVTWAEHIRKYVSAQQAEQGRENLTISIGVIVANGTESVEYLLGQVDTQLYTAKLAGKNNVSF